MIFAVLTGFFVALGAHFINKMAPRYAGYLLSLVPFGILSYLAQYIPAVSTGGTQMITYAWFDAFNIQLSFLIDGLSLIFSLIISGVGAFILIYSNSYMSGHPKQGRFYSYLMMFMASMLGVVLADNMVVLFIFWELTSFTSYLLIGFNHEKEKPRKAALQALLVTGGGGLALLAGFILLANVGGTFSISELIAQNAIIREGIMYLPILTLVFLGAFTKSAQFPFHFWLPNAMEAPSPVSAYLHSATMVKAGVFLLARLNPVLGGTMEWRYVLIFAGGITMVLGAVRALGQTDLKRILAYTTLSALGILIFLVGIDNKLAFSAAVTYLVVHAMYKGALFLIAGALEHETGTRDIRLLGGLRKQLPFLGVAGLLAALLFAGVPPTLGFVSKELIFGAFDHFEWHPIILTSVVLIVTLFKVAAAIMTGLKPFWGKPLPTPKKVHHAPTALWLPPLILASGGALWGIFTGVFSKIFVTPAASAIAGFWYDSDLHLWHGLNLDFALLLFALAGGAALFHWRWLGNKLESLIAARPVLHAESAYNWSLQGMIDVASWQTRFLQNGYLRHYIVWTIMTFLVLGVFTLFNLVDLSAISLRLNEVHSYEILILVIVGLAAIFAIRSKSVLGAIASLGITGFGIALFFVFYGAPDLALTQFSIETLTVVLLVLVVYKIPRFANYSSKPGKIRDSVISIASGGFITVLMLILLSTDAPPSIKEYFLENTYLLAQGKNVVNVILVDFRAFDTLGEITVLSIAAIGVITLLKLRTERKKKSSTKEADQELSK